MPAPSAAPLAPPGRTRGRSWHLGLVVVALLVLIIVRLASLRGGGTPLSVAPPLLLNPCTGEVITLRDPAALLPYLSNEHDGSREVSVNAVGLSGLGTQGNFYLPLGTGKVVLTLANGTLDFAAGGDLELIARDSKNQDFHFHSIAHLTLGAASGLRGSGVAVQQRCGQ